MRANPVTLGLILFGAIPVLAASDAEARGRRGPGIAFVPTATGSIRSEPAVREEPAASLAMPRPTPPVAAPVAAAQIAAAPVATASVRDTRTGQVWCEKGRIVGSGAGFCEIN
ncbi:hypothetical protein [Methylobacterium sp. J-090]|uniref:hypothetical protein n=1 Tax=Methylobacterium sp. J-090 TaxID=2836666 RepID=UPI001FB9A738|nr:hypothetical protein [Methylobacterium sp. J-090]MCJ2080586.1 hypothetical protein [Methylobacterium sp. J-090]